MEKYYVIENRNVGLTGRPEFIETVLFSGTKAECVAYEDSKRKEYKDRTVADCFIQSQSERNNIMLVNDFWNTLTDEEIMQMDRSEVFKEYCLWHGLLGSWYDTLLEVVENIYDVELEERD